jgi:NTP pyrophosphatase (non-canonical NTP hydrolase)
MGDTLRNAGSGTTLDLYQERAIGQAVYPGRGNHQVIYPAVALAEEAGELAGAILERVRMASEGQLDTGFMIAEGALAVAQAAGSVLGLIKKAYRNPPQGELTPERKAAIKAAIQVLRGHLTVLDTVVTVAQQVVFPPLPIPAEVEDKAVKEAGDALWYIASFCTEARVALGYVGDVNYDKLDDRARRGVLAGSGDNR